MKPVPKPKRVKKKKDISNLEKKKRDEFSTYWKTKCNTLTGHIWHTYYSTGICCINTDKCNYWNNKPDMHHLIGKEHYLYTWDVPFNMIDICHYCHDRFSKFGPHSTPELFIAWLAINYEEKWEYIKNNIGTITNKRDLPWTFKEKYYELLELKERCEFQNNINY